MTPPSAVISPAHKRKTRSPQRPQAPVSPGKALCYGYICDSSQTWKQAIHSSINSFSKYLLRPTYTSYSERDKTSFQLLVNVRSKPLSSSLFNCLQPTPFKSEQFEGQVTCSRQPLKQVPHTHNNLWDWAPRSLWGDKNKHTSG